MEVIIVGINIRISVYPWLLLHGIKVENFYCFLAEVKICWSIIHLADGKDKENI